MGVIVMNHIGNLQLVRKKTKNGYDEELLH